MTGSPSDRHKFIAYPAGRFPNSCVRCGRREDDPVHRVQSPTSTPSEGEQDG